MAPTGGGSRTGSWNHEDSQGDTNYGAVLLAGV
jgi:hypothetical protein